MLQVSVSAPASEGASEDGNIVLVVAEGLEVVLPMAGAHLPDFMYDNGCRFGMRQKQREMAEHCGGQDQSDEEKLCTLNVAEHWIALPHRPI
jgi:hypothetical protein